MKPDTSTQLVLDRMKRHADHGPALFSMSSEDAQRVLAWVGQLQDANVEQARIIRIATDEATRAAWASVEPPELDLGEIFTMPGGAQFMLVGLEVDGGKHKLTVHHVVPLAEAEGRPWNVKRALGLAEAEGAQQNETDGAAAVAYELDHSGAVWDVQVATPEELDMMAVNAPIPWKSGGFIWDLPSDLDTGFHPRRSHGRGHYNGDRMPERYRK